MTLVMIKTPVLKMHRKKVARWLLPPSALSKSKGMVLS